MEAELKQRNCIIILLLTNLKVIILYTMCVYACVCVCVCEREREREHMLVCKATCNRGRIYI